MQNLSLAKPDSALMYLHAINKIKFVNLSTEIDSAWSRRSRMYKNGDFSLEVSPKTCGKDTLFLVLKNKKRLSFEFFTDSLKPRKVQYGYIVEQSASVTRFLRYDKLYVYHPKTIYTERYRVNRYTVCFPTRDSLLVHGCGETLRPIILENIAKLKRGDHFIVQVRSVRFQGCARLAMPWQSFTIL